MVPILINKDVSDPSYKDLKFIIWNCNYFFTNLIQLYFVLLHFQSPLWFSKDHWIDFYLAKLEKKKKFSSE